jgi:solute carrier family 25 (mitochondrial aspartate/glutamate transporter), member 12/13
MQNQRNNATVPAVYKNEMDCAKQVLRNEGFLGLYRGGGVQALVHFHIL